MEQWIATRLIGEEVELIGVGNERLSGRVGAVEQGVLTLEWEGRESYVACDKIVAIWARAEGDLGTPHIGFLR